VCSCPEDEYVAGGASEVRSCPLLNVEDEYVVVASEVCFCPLSYDVREGEFVAGDASGES